MIGIGINEFVHLGTDTKVNEKGILEIQLKSASLSDAETLQMVMDGKEISTGSTKLMMFPGFKEDYNTKKRKSNAQLVKELQDYQKLLIKFLKIYLTTDQIEEDFNLRIMVKAAPNEAAFAQGLSSDEFIDKVHTFISTKFVEVLKKYSLFQHAETFRIKLWRQSETKAFPRIPAGFGEWIESMRVTATQLTPSKYEIDNKKLDNTPAAPDSVTKEEVEQEAVANLYGKAEDELPFK
jgi:hypothetical protein